MHMKPAATVPPRIAASDATVLAELAPAGRVSEAVEASRWDIAFLANDFGPGDITFLYGPLRRAGGNLYRPRGFPVPGDGAAIRRRARHQGTHWHLIALHFRA